MKLLKNIVCALGMMVTLATVAQQDPNRNFYRYNMNLVNPAYAGVHDSSEGTISGHGAELGVNFRSQWAGVQGAPETQTAFFSTRIGKNLGIGISVINDRTFIEQQTAIMVDFSYRVNLNDNTDLFFGIKSGANSYNANTSGLTTFGLSQDSSLLNIEGGFKPAIGAGVYLKGNNYFLAFSLPNLTTTERLEDNDGQIKLGDSRTHIYLSGGYDFSLGDNLIFKPSAMARYVNASPLSLDFTAALSFNQRFEFGASYRLNEGVAGLILINAAEWIDLGYAYETPIDGKSVVPSNGTHEVYIKLKM
jgi:type IX secretion system PorP/SprF family membrane protein